MGNDQGGGGFQQVLGQRMCGFRGGGPPRGGGGGGGKHPKPGEPNPGPGGGAEIFFIKGKTNILISFFPFAFNQGCWFLPVSVHALFYRFFLCVG